VHSHAGPKELDAILHWGGLAVKKKYEGRGVGSILADAAITENERAFPQARTTLAQTHSLRAQHVAEKIGFTKLTEIRETIWLVLCGPT
jgi:GNAT superfamily N-acetyltransferase